MEPRTTDTRATSNVEWSHRRNRRYWSHCRSHKRQQILETAWGHKQQQQPPEPQTTTDTRAATGATSDNQWSHERHIEWSHERQIEWSHEQQILEPQTTGDILLKPRPADTENLSRWLHWLSFAAPVAPVSSIWHSWLHQYWLFVSSIGFVVSSCGSSLRYLSLVAPPVLVVRSSCRLVLWIRYLLSSFVAPVAPCCRS